MSLPEPYWQSDDGRHTLYCGDCLAILPHVGRVDAVVTDPPYAVPTLVAQGREITRNAGDLSIAETAYRVYADRWFTTLEDEGRAFVFCDGASYPSLYRAMFSQFNLALLIWDKGRIGMGREFRKSHELILHAWKQATPIYSDGIGRPDIIKCDPVAAVERLHPAEKPVDIVESVLQVCADLILDPFAGSGTTMVAAHRTGRRSIGIEIEPKYCEIAKRRMERELAQPFLPGMEPHAEARQAELFEVPA